TGIRAAITSGSGPLAVAGEAYGSGNMLRAAWVTLLINFFLGSLVSITIPSLIIPGIGIIIALFRAVMWGLLLGPTFVRLSATMLPHSFTLLLEGQAYILATFFALLIPVYLFRKSEGSTVLQRFGRALMMNLRGYLIVLALLVIAAIYESVEVITIMMSN
ncbi:MAG: stage II sporulation protein M, partial [Planctomycetota bacterium]